MCLLFVFLNDGNEEIAYKMVLISNRDEYWVRPTGCADFRGDSRQWIGGIDLEPGREGGTWLGMNKQGQVAVLLNILAFQELDKKGRGNLVTDFVTKPKLSCQEYLDSLSEDQKNYNPFQLILIDLRENNPGFHYLNNVDTDSQHSRTVLHQSTISVDNSINSCRQPWCKTQNGERRFLDILHQHGDISSKETLVERLTDLLNDKTRYFPDPQLQKQFRDVGRKEEGNVIEERSALNVFSPSVKYGTRTNTVILVDQQGNCDYIERSLETPVNVQEPVWSTVQYRFELESDNLLNSDSNLIDANL